MQRFRSGSRFFRAALESDVLSAKTEMWENGQLINTGGSYGAFTLGGKVIVTVHRE
jgi:hypothetical protein